MNQSEMTAKIEQGDGFIAALDQSGGSTPKALQGLRHRGGRLVQRRGDVRPHPPDALADHHLALLQRRQGDRRDPVRADDGRQVDGKPTPQALIDQRRRAVHQDRQGPRGRGERRPADEADARARRAARARQGPRRVRHQGALGHQPRQRDGHRRGGRAAVRGRPPGARPRPGADHRARGEHQERRARRQPTGSCSTRSSKELDAMPEGQR